MMIGQGIWGSEPAEVPAGQDKSRAAKPVARFVGQKFSHDSKLLAVGGGNDDNDAGVVEILKVAD